MIQTKLLQNFKTFEKYGKFLDVTNPYSPATEATLRKLFFTILKFLCLYLVWSFGYGNFWRSIIMRAVHYTSFANAKIKINSFVAAGG